MLELVALLAALGGDVPATRELELRASVTIAGACTSDCDDASLTFGSGEIVARRSDGTLLVLTARHVVEGMSRPYVFFRNAAQDAESLEDLWSAGHGVAAGILSESISDDLALVEVAPFPDDQYAVATLSGTASPAQGDIVGDPDGRPLTISTYRYVANSDDAIVVACASCAHGDSGGGVFDAHGNLAGILVAEERIRHNNEPMAYTEHTGRFHAVALARLRLLLAYWRSDSARANPPENPWNRFAHTH